MRIKNGYNFLGLKFFGIVYVTILAEKENADFSMRATQVAYNSGFPLLDYHEP